jgi:hypothetical protein
MPRKLHSAGRLRTNQEGLEHLAVTKAAKARPRRQGRVHTRSDLNVQLRRNDIPVRQFGIGKEEPPPQCSLLGWITPKHESCAWTSFGFARFAAAEKHGPQVPLFLPTTLQRSRSPITRFVEDPAAAAAYHGMIAEGLG